MILFPPNSFTIETKLTPEQVLALIQTNSQLEYGRSFFWGKTSDKFFIGNVRRDSFAVSRATRTRNYTPPLFEGKISRVITGTKVEIVADYTMSQKWFFLAIVAVFVAAFFMPWILNEVDENNEYFPLIAFCFMLLSFYVSFVIEIILVRRKFLYILNGTLKAGE